VFDQVVNSIAVISLIRRHDGARSEIAQKRISGTAVGDIVAGQEETERSSFAIGEGVELAVAPALANPDRLMARSLFRRPPNGVPSYACCRSEPRREGRLPQPA
jgi:hypothetical protein